MDPALHVRRGHGQRCVFSARGVGTVCARCVAEVLSFTGPEPLAQRDHASVLALPTTRARYARALAELVRDPGAGPDVADAWGHVLVAACVDAIVADDTNDPEAVTAPCVESVARLARTSARLDGGELLDAAVDRVLAHLDAPLPLADADEGLPAGVLGLPSPPGGASASQHPHPARASHPAIPSDPRATATPDRTRRNRENRETSREEDVSSPRAGLRDSQSTASHAHAFRESQNSVGVGVGREALPLARRQPYAPGFEHGSTPRDDERERERALFFPFVDHAAADVFARRDGDGVFPRGGFQNSEKKKKTFQRRRGSVRLLRLLAALLRVDVHGGDFVPSSFREPAPAPGLAPAPGVAAIAERLAAEKKAPPRTRDSRGGARDFPAAKKYTLETRLAALDAAAAFVARADAGNAAALASLRAGNAAAATALALGAAGAAAAAAEGAAPQARGGNRFPARDPEDGLVLALEVIDALARHCGVDLEAMTSPAACVTFSSPGYVSAGWNQTHPRPSPLAETLRAGALFPSLSVRAAACACVSSAVTGQSPEAVARLVRDDVLEHVFEVLRDAGRERSGAEARGREAHALADARGAADAARRAALACLMDVLRATAPDPEAAHLCATRMGFGMDVMAATLTRSTRARDAETASAALRLARGVAELGDPGTVPGTTAGRLADALLDTYEALPADAVSLGPGLLREPPADGFFMNGGGNEKEKEKDTSLCRAEACAAVTAMLAWPSLADAAAAAAERGDRAETSARARRVFERLAQDVARNLRGFGEEEDTRDGATERPGSPYAPRPGSPYAASGGRDERDACFFVWDLPDGAAEAMCGVLCDHFEPEDTPVAERVLSECGMHAALAGALFRLAESRETYGVQSGSGPANVAHAVAAVARAYGSLLFARAAEPEPEPRPRPHADPFEEDPNESEATVDGTGNAVAVLEDETCSSRDARLTEKKKGETAKKKNAITTRFARDAVRRGVLAAALVAAAAGPGVFSNASRRPSLAPRHGGFDTHSGSSETESHEVDEVERDVDDREASADGLLENFVGVVLAALDDAACRDAGRCILLGGPFSFAAAFGANDALGANASEDLITRCALTAVFAHVKYASGDDPTSTTRRGGERLLARIAPVVARALGSGSARDEVIARAADDSCLFAFAVASATETNRHDSTFLECAWRVAQRAREEKEGMTSYTRAFAGGAYTTDAFASFAEFLRSGTSRGVRAMDRLASAVVFRDDESPFAVSRDEIVDAGAQAQAVASLLLEGLVHPRTRRWFEVGDGDDDAREANEKKTKNDAADADALRVFDPRKFVEGLCQSTAAIVLLASRACLAPRRATYVHENEKAEVKVKVAFAVSPWGATRARWVGRDEANGAMDALLFTLSRRPATPAVAAAAGHLWRLLGESSFMTTDSAFVDRMTIASLCALVELDEREGPSGAAGPGPGPAEKRGQQKTTRGRLDAFEGSLRSDALAALTVFSAADFRSHFSVSELPTVVPYHAFGAAATMRFLAAALAAAARRATEAPDPRRARMTLCSYAVADAARAAARHWHREAVAPTLPDSTHSTHSHSTERGTLDPREDTFDDARMRRRLVREARRAAIDLLRVTAAIHEPRAEHAADGLRVVGVLADVADDPEDGVAALDALAAWALAETPSVTARGGLTPAIVSLVLQSGRAAMCAASEEARDAGAACLWAAMRSGEAGETRDMSREDRAEDGAKTRDTHDPDDYDVTFEDMKGHWEASLLEDWLSDVETARSRRFQTEGRLRFAATLARVAPGAFSSKVVSSQDAARRLFRHATCSLVPPSSVSISVTGCAVTQMEISPGALATLRALVDAGAAKLLDRTELAGVRAVCANARLAHGETKRDEAGFRRTPGSCHAGHLRGGERNRNLSSVKDNETNDARAYESRDKNCFDGDCDKNVFEFGPVATATPRWFPRRGADPLAALDALVASLDAETDARTRGRACVEAIRF